MSTKREQVRKEWQRHIIAAKRSHQSAASYCQEHNIGVASFYNWRRKLQSEVENEFMVPATGPFSRLEIIKEVTTGLPEAKWLAEFIHHLSHRGDQ